MAMHRHRGFTLVELFLVVAMVVLIASILLPALSNAREQSRRVACLSNLRQLHAAYIQYATENDGIVLPCDKIHAQTGFPADEQANDIPPLRAYTHDSRVFHCISDERQQAHGAPRSYSINDYLGGSFQYPDLRPAYPVVKHARHLRDVTNAATTFLWIEETPVTTLNGFTGGFVVLQYPLQLWADFPGILHRNGTCIVFVDGHSEFLQWNDQGTTTLALTSALQTSKRPFLSAVPTSKQADLPDTSHDLLRLQSISGNGGVPPQ
jgi:type II secretory pathway pseudopilin PulG